MIPFGILICLVGHWFDRQTYDFIKEHTYGGNANQEQGFADNQSSPQGLTEHQKELLKIPLTAKRISLFSITPALMLIAMKLIWTDDHIVRLHLLWTIFAVLSCLRIIIILKCLLKANEANQVQMSAEERRLEMIKWERTHSYRFLKQQEEARQALESPLPGTSSQSSNTRRTQQVGSSQHQQGKRQILDPGLLEQIINDVEDQSKKIERDGSMNIGFTSNDHSHPPCPGQDFVKNRNVPDLIQKGHYF